MLVEVNCETDFVARGDVFKELANDMAMQVAACSQVTVVDSSQVPTDVVDKERNVQMGKEDILKKPEAIRSVSFTISLTNPTVWGYRLSFMYSQTDAVESEPFHQCIYTSVAVDCEAALVPGIVPNQFSEAVFTSQVCLHSRR